MFNLLITGKKSTPWAKDGSFRIGVIALYFQIVRSDSSSRRQDWKIDGSGVSPSPRVNCPGAMRWSEAAGQFLPAEVKSGDEHDFEDDGMSEFGPAQSAHF